MIDEQKAIQRTHERVAAHLESIENLMDYRHLSLALQTRELMLHQLKKIRTELNTMYLYQSSPTTIATPYNDKEKQNGKNQRI